MILLIGSIFLLTAFSFHFCMLLFNSFLMLPYDLSVRLATLITIVVLINSIFTLATAIHRMMNSEEKEPHQEQVVLDSRTLHRYFPKSYTTKQMQETIIQLLEKWQQKQ